MALPNPILSEHQEQMQFVSWFKKNYLLTKGIRIFAIPNGGLRGKREAQNLKNEGVSAGVPDLYIPEWKLWIEMKRAKGGVVSPEQKDWHEYLKKIGDKVVIAKGFEEAKKFILEL